MPKYGESEAAREVKRLITEALSTRERAMLQAWLLAKFDVRGYDRDKYPQQ
jgi:hypothetical protein